jgi:hypothetical protein
VNQGCGKPRLRHTQGEKNAEITLAARYEPPFLGFLTKAKESTELPSWVLIPPVQSLAEFELETN